MDASDTTVKNPLNKTWVYSRTESCPDGSAGSGRSWLQQPSSERASFVDSPFKAYFVGLGFGALMAFHFWILLARIALTFRSTRSSGQPIPKTT